MLRIRLDSYSRLPLYLTQILAGMAWVTLGPILNPVLDDLNIDLARGGVLSLAFFFGTVAGLASFNAFFARVPVKYCLFGVGLLQAAGLVISGLASRDLWSFLIPYFFVGFCTVLLGTIPGIWLSAHIKQGSAKALTIMMMWSVSAMILTPLVLGALISTGVSWRVLLCGEGALALLITAVVAHLPLADIRGRENLRLRHLKSVVRFSPALFAAIVGASFLYLGAEMTLGVWMPKFLVDTFGATDSWAGLTVTLYFVGQNTGRALIMPLIARVPTWALLMGTSGFMAVLAALISLAPNQTAALLLVFGAGIGSSAAFSFIGSYSSRFPHWHAGVVFSGFQLVGGIGAMLFPYLTGPIASAWGFRAAIAVAALPAIMVAGMALVFRKASGGKARAE